MVERACEWGQQMWILVQCLLIIVTELQASHFSWGYSFFFTINQKSGLGQHFPKCVPENACFMSCSTEKKQFKVEYIWEILNITCVS